MYVPQVSFSLEDTLIKNIAFSESNKDIDTEKVKKCLNLVDLNSKVESLPLKLQTIVSGGGLNFSGGERQRLLLARALYNQFEFIILDEATSALDYKTEKKILTNLKQLNKTTLLISHDQKILAECDKVYFLENGKIIKKKLHEYF